jgi:hypothetical protein
LGDPSLLAIFQGDQASGSWGLSRFPDIMKSISLHWSQGAMIKLAKFVAPILRNLMRYSYHFTWL